jgi:hypothetical protein
MIMMTMRTRMTTWRKFHRFASWTGLNGSLLFSFCTVDPGTLFYKLSVLPV